MNHSCFVFVSIFSSLVLSLLVSCGIHAGLGKLGMVMEGGGGIHKFSTRIDLKKKK